MNFYSCTGTDLYTLSNLLTSCTLLSMIFTLIRIQYQANLTNSLKCFFLIFDVWRNEIIFYDHYNWTSYFNCFSQIGLKRRIKQKNTEFEMKIVEQDRMEKRALYIDEYKDDKKLIILDDW